MYRKSRLRCGLLLYLKLAGTYSKVHPEEKLWKSYWFSIFSIRTGESWMVNGIDEFISNGILKPMLSSGSYEEYARIYNRAFLTEYTADEIREAVENGDADGYVDKLGSILHGTGQAGADAVA